MRRIVIIAVLATLLVGAQPALADGTVDTVTIIGGESKTVRVDIGNASVQALQITGPLTVEDRTTKNGTLILLVKAKKPDTRQDGKIYIALKDAGERTVTFDIVPFHKYKNAMEVSKDTRQDAKKWRQFKDQWINTRVDRKQTGQGVLVVYEQRLPHRGPIGPDGMPKGKWVRVPYNETKKQPMWFYQTPSGAMSFMAKQAHRNAVFRRNTLLLAAGIGITPFIVTFVILPYWRRRRDRAIWRPGGNK